MKDQQACDTTSNTEMMTGNGGSGGGIQLKKSVGLLSGVTIIVGSIIGSGIFITPSGALIRSGSVGMSLLVWLVSGICSSLGALSFAELGTTISRSGGEYAYILECFGRIPAFLYLWVNIIMVRPIMLAVVAMAFGYYLPKPFLEGMDDANLTADQTKYLNDLAKIIAAIGILLLVAINCASVKIAIKIQDLFTLAKLIALGCVIIAGVVRLCQGQVQNFADPFKGTNGAIDVSMALYSGLFAYVGWNFLNCVVDELKDPYRNLPRAIIIGMPLVTVVYVLTNIAYFVVLTPQEMLTSSAVAFDFASKLNRWFAWAMPVFVSLSAIGSANGILFTSGRILMIGAQEKQLPAILSMIHAKRLTPIPAIALLGLVSMVYLIGSDINLLIIFFCFSFFFFIGLCILGLIWLRYKRPNMPRPIKYNILLHFVFLLICIFLIVMPLLNNFIIIGYGIIGILLGIPVYFVCQKLSSTKNCFSSSTRSISDTLQKCLFVIAPDTRSE